MTVDLDHSKVRWTSEGSLRKVMPRECVSCVVKKFVDSSKQTSGREQDKRRKRKDFSRHSLISDEICSE